jgi:hypothetical protein
MLGLGLDNSETKINYIFDIYLQHFHIYILN